MHQDIFVFSRYALESNVGGVESIVRVQLDILKKAGHRPHHYFNAKAPKKFPRFFLIFSRVFQPFSLSTFRQLIRCLKTDSLIIIHYPEVFYPLAFWLASVKANVMVFHHADIIFSFPLIGNMGKIVAFFHQPMYQKAQMISFTSHTYWQHSLMRTFCPAAKVKILPLTSSFEENHLPPFEPVHLSRGNKLKLLAIGRMVSYKGLFFLLKAFARLDESYELTLVGDGALRASLEKYWKKKAGQARVVFTGFLPTPELIAKIKDCHGLILTSLTRQEAFGVVLVEALSLGRPIISPKIIGSGVREINPEGQYGSEFEPGVVTSLLKAIKNLRNRLHLEGENLSRQCREKYYQKYRRHSYGKNFLEIISPSPSKRQVYLHIGYPKTATTTLQNDIFPYCANVLYLGKCIGKYEDKLRSDMVPPSLIYDLYSDNSKFHLKVNDYNRMLKNLPHCSLMFSDENLIQLHLLSTIKKNAHNIKKLFDGYSIKLLISLRRQSDLIESMYNQSYILRWRKHPQLNSLDLFVDNLLASDISESKYNFKYVLDAYVQHFGRKNVGLFIYEELKSHPNAFLTSLLQFLQESDLSLNYSLSTLNQRFSNKDHCYTLWNFVSDWKNRVLHRRLLPLSLNRYLAYLFKQVTFYNVSQNRFQLTQAQRTAIDDKFCQSNRKLSKDFALNLKQYGYF